MTRALAVVAVFASAWTGAAAPQVFSSKTVGVRVDVLVTDAVSGKPVGGLTAADFEVRDNGVLQSVESIDVGDIPINVVLALDASGSTAGKRLDDLRNATRTLLDDLKPVDRAALITFNHAVSPRVPLTSDVRQIRAVVGQPHAVRRDVTARRRVRRDRDDPGRARALVRHHLHRRPRHVELGAARRCDREREALERRRLRRRLVWRAAMGAAQDTGGRHGRPADRDRVERADCRRIQEDPRGFPQPVRPDVHSRRGHGRRIPPARRARPARATKVTARPGYAG